MRFSTGVSFLVCAVLAAAFSFGGAVAESSVRGVVYDDANGNRVFDDGDSGLPGVGVSNGRDVVETDAEGGYELPVSDDTIVFVIKPRGWRPERDANQISRFYYIHKPEGSPDREFRFRGVKRTGPLPRSVNFAMYRQDEADTFDMICFGDTQPRNLQEVDYIARDVLRELIGVDAAFGITLGDVVFNDLSMFEPLEDEVAKIGVPWYNIHGNHDTNMDSGGDKYSDETWERLYGPTYYSFDYGPVHFVVLDDIAWDGDEKYHGELGEDQTTFLANDLARVPDERLVVLMMHIPLLSVNDRQIVYDLLAKHEHNLSLAAHTHRQTHHFIGADRGWKGADKHHHLVHATVCGSWWAGAKDDSGIPHATMSDGVPNGYSIITFDKDEYSVRFKAASEDPDYQMNIYAPPTVSAANAAETQVAVNVFAGSERSTVEMRLGDNGDWRPMELTPMLDPGYVRIKAAEDANSNRDGRKLPKPSTSTHMWTLNLPPNPAPGTTVIHVRTTDMFGQTYTGRRAIVVR
ncbi:MAG: calcineurin-like phosphoesterase family protein [Candidatus Hydrogenedentes bacterium]|nr:calcineurin-like phosphoesterase family protein [Candidatus Hydrogenedentota bacterium]